MKTILETPLKHQSASKLIGQIIKKSLDSVYLLLVALRSPFYVVIGDPDFAV